MRITVNLDDDVLRVVRQIAREKRQSLGSVISELVRSGFQRRTIPTLPKKPGGRPVTTEAVSELLEQDAAAPFDAEASSAD